MDCFKLSWLKPPRLLPRRSRIKPLPASAAAGQAAIRPGPAKSPPWPRFYTCHHHRGSDSRHVPLGCHSCEPPRARAAIEAQISKLPCRRYASSLLCEGRPWLPPRPPQLEPPLRLSSSCVCSGSLLQPISRPAYVSAALSRRCCNSAMAGATLLQPPCRVTPPPPLTPPYRRPRCN